MSDFKCDPLTRTQLDASQSKLGDAAVIIAALGATGRRIVAKRDSNANAADPWATGTVFRNVGCSGTIKTVAGKIKSFGRIKGTTVSLAANLSSGSSVLRVQSADGSRWIQVSLGAPGSGKDVIAGTITATNGFALKPDFAISGKQLKASGTGPAAPALTADAPARFKVWNWSNPNAPTLAGTVNLNKRVDDFVFEDAELATIMGDVAVYQSTESAILGNHEFGFTLFASHAGNTETGATPLYQALGAVAHRGTWTSYPFRDSYDVANHVSYPDPFKVTIENQSGTVIGTLEMRDGLPINSPLLSQVWDSNNALRPHFNCFMQLPWENTRPKMSPKATKYYTGIATDYQRPSMAKSQTTFNGVEPMITGWYEGNSRNGIHNIYHCLKWPAPRANQDPLPRDPYGVIDSEFNRSGASAEHSAYVDGYGYEPGSFSCHNWYSGPGGPRNDRSVIASVIALYITDPNGVRLQGNVSRREQLDGWLFGYFNHSNKWVTDPKTLKFVDNSRILNGEMSMSGCYYGDYPNIPQNQVHIDGYKRDQDGPRDKTGRYLFDGWARDPLHDYAQAGWGALAIQSPLMAIASKFDTTTAMMLRQAPDSIGGWDDYMVRTQAWDWFQHVMAWKLSSTHSLGFSRAEIEDRFIKRLLRVWEDIYKPVFIDNSQERYHAAIRTFGCPLVDNDWAWGNPGGQLAFYMTHVLALMKQCGMWSVLMAKGGKIRDVLLMQIRNMDTHCFNRLVYTKYSRAMFNGYSDGRENQDGGYFKIPKNDPIPASWAAWSAASESPNSAYWLEHNAISRTGRRDVSDPCDKAPPTMRRDFFPEIPHPLLDQALVKLAELQGHVAQNVGEGTSPADKRNRDFNYGYPGVAPMKAPTELGPA